MGCAVCSHENPPRARFCQQCGARVEIRCAGCGSKLPPSARFCHDCGLPVADATSATPERRVYTREVREAHRLFIEVGATGWAERVAKELGA